MPVTLTSGCSSTIPYIKLEQRVIIQAMGVDYEEGVYTATMQYSTNEKPDASGGGEVKIIKGMGVNLYAAIAQARNSEGEHLFFMQNQILLLGMSVIENNAATETIRQYLEYCDRLPDAIVAGCYSKAEDVISMKDEEQRPMRNKFRIIMETAERTGVFPNEKIHEAMTTYTDKSESFYLPMLKLVSAETSGEKEGQSEDKKGAGGGENGGNGGSGGGGSDEDKGGEKKKIVPYGGALIAGGKFAAIMDAEASAGLTILLNRAHTANVTFRIDDTNYSIELYDINCSIKPKRDGDTLTFTVKVKAKADRSFNRVLFENGDKVAKLEEAAKNAIIYRLKQSVEQSAAEHGGDILMLEENLRHYSYNAWIKTEDDWANALKNAVYKFEVRLSMK